MGNRADSFYEYLLKSWLLTGKKEEVIVISLSHVASADDVPQGV